jgi:chromosome segregation ATPase
LRRREETLAEIERLLTGPSIELSEAETPLAQRELIRTDGRAHAVTPDEILAGMIEAFDGAKEVVLSLEAAWARLQPAFEAAEEKVRALRQRAEALGPQAGAIPELRQAQQRLELSRSRVVSDPFGVAELFDAALAPLLTGARARLEELEAERATVTAELEQAQRLLADLVEANAACRSTLQECQQQIEPRTDLRAPLPPPDLEQMATWLATLAGAHREGRWQAARIGLERWRESASPMLAAERDAARANRLALETLAELKGRLGALEARARALRSSDATLERLALQARLLLDQPPVPLQRAASLIAACEKRLRES